MANTFLILFLTLLSSFDTDTRRYLSIYLFIYHTASNLPLSVLFLGSSLTLNSFFFFLPLSHTCKLPCSGDTLIPFFYLLCLVSVWLRLTPFPSFYLFIFLARSCVSESVCECRDHYLCLCVCVHKRVCTWEVGSSYYCSCSCSGIAEDCGRCADRLGTLRGFRFE